MVFLSASLCMPLVSLGAGMGSLMGKGVEVHDIHCVLKSYKFKFLEKLVI